MHTKCITKDRESHHDPIASSKLASCVFKVFSLTYSQSAFVKWQPVVLFISPFCLQLIHHQILLIPIAKCISNPPIAFHHCWPYARFVHHHLLARPLMVLPAFALAFIVYSLCTTAKSIILEKLIVPFLKYSSCFPLHLKSKLAAWSDLFFLKRPVHTLFLTFHVVPVTNAMAASRKVRLAPTPQFALTLPWPIQACFLGFFLSGESFLDHYFKSIL